MIKNLFLVALRNLKRDKWYGLLNILGLTIGITFSLFLIFYIKDELSYDRYHKNADRIYRIASYNKEPDKPEMKWAVTPASMAPALKRDYPEVDQSLRMLGTGKTMFKNGDLRFYEDAIFLCDSNIFKVFSYNFIEGNPNSALIEPHSMVLTQSSAEKFFGRSTGIIGKTLQNNRGEIFKITGVIKDVPKNSHLVFNALISISTLPKDFDQNWGNFGIYTYVLLKPNVSPALFQQKLAPLYKKYLEAIFAPSNIKIRFVSQPLTSIHLHSDLEFEPSELGSMSYIYIFAAVAFFMLLIACINYMNLTTARSARRAKEIGIRKVTGSSKLQLVTQFLVESLLTAVFALILSLGLIAILLHTFNSVAGKFITFQSLFEPGTFLILLAVVLFVGLAGGCYPAFYLSKFNPVNILKGSLSKSSSNATLRRSLVVVQFSVSMIMLICTWIVYGQLKYLRNKDLGFNNQQVLKLSVNSDRDNRGQIHAFTNELKKNPKILSVSTSESMPGGKYINFNLLSVQTETGFKNQGIDCYGIDERFFPTLGMKLKEGRNFSGLADTLRSVIVNENMVKFFGWKNAIGKKVKYPGDTSSFYLEVVGVVKDFNQKSLYNPIAPLLMFYRPNSPRIQLKLSSQDLPSTLKNIEKIWKSSFPGLPFSYSFLDEDFDSQYIADQKRGKIFTAFSILTIIITCLGLLGLVAFTTEQRQKEISIRKVMGAGVSEIVPLITTNFILLVGISCFIAFPVAYVFMDKWLKIFPYNTGLNVTPFILSAITVLFITLFTVIFHTVKAALNNPVKSLRTE
ncbi:FtsX-like permease family protein [Pedobacter sp. HMF7647]|uniref:FtsX-like permease family protein n=1 Tax=Hufsiella arboris TaxID=2695275 RepID=A0A7K1YA36_9SPHI|nr:ABC transporter permease [Hufsiella arboris]MXV51456.1 FtsX-like permease family protein [Hufsiella arboris]